MGLFSKKTKSFDLEEPRIQQLLATAAQMNYGAVLELHQVARQKRGSDPTWDWWITLTQEAMNQGHTATARMAVEFAYNAGNIPPWGDLSNEDYERLRPLRDGLGLG